MNEKINIINLNNSGEKVFFSIKNFEGIKPSIEMSGIENINLGNAKNIYINNNQYKEINAGQNGGKIIGNIQAQEFINTNLSDVHSNGIYVNGIKFIPDYIIIEGVTKMVLVAEE
jgi:hypothetical protein